MNDVFVLDDRRTQLPVKNVFRFLSERPAILPVMPIPQKFIAICTAREIERARIAERRGVK